MTQGQDGNTRVREVVFKRRLAELEAEFRDMKARMTPESVELIQEAIDWLRESARD